MRICKKKEQHQFYWSVDRRAKPMHVCVVNQAGEILVHRNLPTSSHRFLSVIARYRHLDLVVAVECVFTWYWLADICTRYHFPFV